MANDCVVNADGIETCGLPSNSWWYSSTAYAIKWAVVTGIFVLFLVYFVLGYMHARRRMKKGLPPLAYHRWLVPRRQRIAFVQQHPQYANQFSFYRQQQARVGPYGGYGWTQAQGGYQMGGMYGPPPPAYGAGEFVPAYTPAAPPNKVDPDQRFNHAQAQNGGDVTSGGPAAPEPARTAR